jgi:hypothetical protein
MISSLKQSILVLSFILCCIGLRTKVFAQTLDSVAAFNGLTSVITIPSAPSISPASEMTVSLWFKPTRSNWTSKPETILSKRSGVPVSNYSDPKNWGALYNATNQSGMNDIKGFVGGVFDGRYIYCSPWWKGQEPQEVSGKILRYDTHLEFNDSTSWQVYDAENEDGIPDIRGLEGAVFDGKYVYFVPLHHEGIYYSKVLRYNTTLAFNDEASWEVFNAEPLDSTGTMKGFIGAVFDGNYVYFVSNGFAPNGKFLRFNIREDFQDPKSWQIFDLNVVLNYDYTKKGFFGGIFDGKYLYFVPFSNGGTVLRYNTQMDFLDQSSWNSITLKKVMPGATIASTYAGAAFDGRYIYFSPINQGTIVRYDTKGDFYSSESWHSTSVLNLDSLNGVYGGIGPTFDGRYVYFPPEYGLNGRSGKTIIYDTEKDFFDLQSFTFFDLTQVDKDLRGFEGSVSDGQYIYFMPMNFESPHAKIIRYNTTPSNTLSYELEYNQSASSFGSVLQAMRFKVGTELGVRNVFLRDQPALADGEWHHIVATYDGKDMKIYLDGELNNETRYDDVAAITTNTADLTIGKVAPAASSGYEGLINEVSIWSKALTKDQVEDILFNGVKPDAQNLSALWNFDEGKSSIWISDASANDNKADSISDISYRTIVSAGLPQATCPDESYLELLGGYPAGGFWSGPGIIVPLGIFQGTKELADSAFNVYYQIERLFAGKPKAFAAAKQITVYSRPADEIVAPKDLLCEGDTMTLSAPGVFTAYEWSDGETTKTIDISAANTYTLRVSTAEGCNFTLNPFVVHSTSAAEPQILAEGIKLTTTAAATKYEWFYNSQPVVDTTNQLIPLDTGIYQLRIRDVNGCLSPLSTYHLTAGVTALASVEELRNNLLVFPNPSKGAINIDLDARFSNGKMSILNSLGQSIHSTELSNESGNLRILVDLPTSLENGIYFIHIKAADGHFVSKFLLSR